MFNDVSPVCTDYNNYDNSPWIGNSPGGGYRNGPGGGSGGGGGGMGGGSSMKQYGGHNGNMGGDRRNIGVHCVHMRGLPFKATQQDVAYVSAQHNNKQQQ